MRWYLIAGLSVVVLWLLAVLVLFWLGRKTLARELITLLPNLLRLFRGLLGDERVPRSSKALLLLGAVWLASPIDLIPEFLPGRTARRRGRGRPGASARRQASGAGHGEGPLARRPADAWRDPSGRPRD